MAKIAKPKKREASVHSRAFRRNATPPKELPASKKTAEDSNEHWLYNAQNAGVHKKTKGKRGNTRQQHVRTMKAMEKADRNSAVLETKITKSKLQSKKIQARAKDWDELNEELIGLKPKQQIAPTATAEMEEVEENGGDVENIVPPAMKTHEQSKATALDIDPISEGGTIQAQTGAELDIIT